jgi:gliding motility-associated-like protein
MKRSTLLLLLILLFQFGCTKEEATPEARLASSGSCAGNAPQNVRIDGKDLKIGDVFTPNKDGINDTFFIRNLPEISQLNLVVFNSAGNKVYENNSYKNDFSAKDTNGNVLPIGKYSYKLQIGNTNLEGKFCIARTKDDMCLSGAIAVDEDDPVLANNSCRQ